VIFFGESHRDTYANLKGYQFLTSFLMPHNPDIQADSLQSIVCSIPVTPNIVGAVYANRDIPVNPSNSAKRIPNLLWATSQMAAFWRGSINYRFVLPPQLMTLWKVRFFPRVPWLTPSPLNEWYGNRSSITVSKGVPSTDAAYRDVSLKVQAIADANGVPGMELQSSLVNGVLSVTVPFWDPRPVAPITRTSLRTGEPGVMYHDNAIGSLVLTCEELQAKQVFVPTGVAWDYPTMEVYIAAGDDFMLSTPVPPPTTYHGDLFTTTKYVENGVQHKFKQLPAPAVIAASPERAEQRSAPVVKQNEVKKSV